MIGVGSWGVFLVTFLASLLRVENRPCFGWVFGPILVRQWTQNQPKIYKKLLFFVTFFALRFFIVFLRFLLNFRGLRTSGIVLTPTREHDFREIAVFVFGPLFRWILAHFGFICDPQKLRNGLRDPLEKKVDFWYLFCRILGQF